MLMEDLKIDPSILPTPIRAALEALGNEVVTLRQRIEQLSVQLNAAEALADYDPLCPVFNRRAFIRELDREIAVSARYKTPLSVLYIDLDRFKQINDICGHARGDQILVDLARQLLSAVRRSDIVGRLGGDEFAITLPRAGPDAAGRKAVALMLDIEANMRQSAAPSGHALDIGASCGVATWRPGEGSETLLKRADADMFRIKSKRRGQRSPGQDQPPGSADTHTA